MEIHIESTMYGEKIECTMYGDSFRGYKEWGHTKR